MRLSEKYRARQNNNNNHDKKKIIIITIIIIRGKEGNENYTHTHTQCERGIERGEGGEGGAKKVVGNLGAARLLFSAAAACTLRGGVL